MEWPPELDALVVAPEHHRLLFENERVRVLDTRIAAGDSVPVHTHRWPSLYYVISSAQFVGRDDAGEVLLDTRELEQPFELRPPCGRSRCLPTRSKTWTSESSA